MSEPDLNAAYALETAEDNRKLYADWAQSYDATFAETMDYQMPQQVAAILCEVCPAPARVLDIGAGTGLVAQALQGAGFEIDGLDISPQMLAVAGEKALYQQLIEADLTGPIDIAENTYDGIVSAGTFTHGHVGPDALDHVVRIVRPGGVCVLGVNAEHFEARGFADKFAALGPLITGLEYRLIDIYGAAAQDAHAADQAKVVVFRKL